MLSLINVIKARNRIGRFIRRTPLYASDFLSSRYKARVYLKLENQQVTGSFKIRGAINKILKHRNVLSGRKLLTVSTGNHAIAVAHASRILGIESLIIVPENITKIKRMRIEAAGGKVLVMGKDYDEAERYAKEMLGSGSYLFLSPYNDPDIIEATATIGLEILEDEPDTDVIIVPVGGGGLISGISFIAKNLKKEIKVYGVQSEASPAMYESFKKGRIVKVSLAPSIAEGLYGNIEESSITFDFVKKYVDDILLVSEREIKEAIRELYFSEGILAEGAAAITLAALKRYGELFENKKVCLVISGGNIDPEHFIEVFQEY